MDERFSRFGHLVGEKAMQALWDSHVLVVGIGGVGCGAVEALARSGVGRLTLVDDDVVDITNINRQLVALSCNIGQKKAEQMALRVMQISPQCHVEARCQRLNALTLEALLTPVPQFVVDCIDDMEAKVLLAKRCEDSGIALVSCMGAGNRLDPGALHICDIFQTKSDPVARIMRRRLRQEGVRKLCVCASDELPVACRIATPSGRFSPGSAAFVPPVAGMLMASYVVRKLLETPYAAGN